MRADDDTETDRPAGFWQSLLYRVEAGVFLAVMGFFRLLGLERASALGGFIARTIGPLISVSKRADDNLKLAMPELSDEERARIIKAMWDNLGRTFAEYPHFDQFHARDPSGRIVVEGEEHALGAVARGKGAIIFSGHFANWELMPMAALSRGIDGGTIYRAINNPYVDEWIVRQRKTYTFPDQIAKGAHGVRRLMRHLRNGRSLFMLVDQKMNDGIAVPFFGHAAMTPAAPALLAMRFSSALVPVWIRREPGPRFTVRAYPEIEVAQTGDVAADMATTLTRINAFFEARIREAPENWLWLHRRWPKEVGRSDRAASFKQARRQGRRAEDPAAPETS
ncbi:MAG: hypothetical protein GC199_06005 [Alphaproteobacteria bacterium]|nr:hypothetical protein [Alphaproteobacteria bacterium]